MIASTSHRLKSWVMISNRVVAFLHYQRSIRWAQVSRLTVRLP